MDGEGASAARIARGRVEDERSDLVGRLLSLVAERRLHPGERLPSERELAERFAVGRNAVREAIAVLETVRMVERRPNSGIYLRAVEREGSLEALVLRADLGVPLTAGEVTELIDLRRILELQGTELACERREAEDLARIAAALEVGARSIAAAENFADSDAEFHLSVAAATRNRLFLRLINSFYLLSRTRRRRYFADGSRAGMAQAQHRAMAEAIERADAPAAVALMRAHLKGAESYWLELLQNRGPGGETPA
ncbi:FadR family transcriptional regulator [Belnapia sp. T6]|uniref:FadR family transcriptional regulator n=1 Tax=Belnapia mucosa TaxID=2804532 RepID=A0ABS1V112_9PROT|nr:FadR/GntR family transcriptional regulator [Belnapia mucosa]MBL6455394.1 FadR family transcriptional regulator [Belnapia mucosa]